MSSQKWNSDADFLQDLQLLSSKHESLASAKASIELQRQSQPVKFQTTFGRGKKSTNNSDFSGLEDDPWNYANFNKDTSDYSPLGVRSSSRDSKEALGRAQKLAPYIQAYRNKSYNFNGIEKELKNCGLNKEHSNLTIRRNFEASVLKTEQEKKLTPMSSDSEEKALSFAKKKRERKDLNLKFKKDSNLLPIGTTLSPSLSHSESNSSSPISSESDQSSPIPSCSNSESGSSNDSPKPGRLTVIERLFQCKN